LQEHPAVPDPQVEPQPAGGLPEDRPIRPGGRRERGVKARGGNHRRVPVARPGLVDPETASRPDRRARYAPAVAEKAEPLIVWKGPDQPRPFLVPLGSLEPFPGNPRRGDIVSLRDSLKRFGQPRPALADPALGDGGRLRLVAGHHLALAASA